MGEFELIARYFASANCAQVGGALALGIGDDCALIEPAAGQCLAVSTDTLVAGIHFPNACAPNELGQRALAVAASDLAAMGAEPLAFTLALTLPEASPSWLQAFAAGLNQMALDCGIRLAGGDTTRGPLSITVTVFGQTPKGAALTRSGAQIGDQLCVVGALGEAAAALPLVLGVQQAGRVADALLSRYWSPQPQLALGQALRGRAHAVLDLSDGLLADAAHLAKASRVALVVYPERVPLNAAAVALFGHAQALHWALTGGDDYRLLFCMPALDVVALQAEGWPARVIGQVEPGEGVWLGTASGHRHPPPSRTGYRHF